MPSFTGTLLTTLKLTGTAALGILTGAHLTFSVSTLQNAVISPSAISVALEHHRKRITLPLTLYGTSALILTYLFSPSHGRHPYLLIASIMPIVGFGVHAGVLKEHCKLGICKKKSKSSRPTPASSNEDEFEEITKSVVYDKNKQSPSPGERTPTNAQEAEGDPAVGVGADEADHEHVEIYRFANLLNAAVTGLGFAIGLVGTWGEGYYYYS